MSSNEASSTIEIVPHDCAWTSIYERKRVALEKALPRDLYVEVHHVGSTSIPSMPAKPIVDILVLVENLERNRSIYIHRLEAIGYDYLDAESKSYRLMFAYRDQGGQRTVHVHVGSKDTSLYTMLRFQELLRTDRQLRSSYVALKKELARRYLHDRKGYQEGKRAFILNALASSSASKDGA